MTLQLLRRLGTMLAIAGGWLWLVVAGGGGLGLLILQGPWIPTNGWFALFSGIAACPLWQKLAKGRGRSVPVWVQPTAVVLFIVAGRVALVVERHLGIQLPPPL